MGGGAWMASCGIIRGMESENTIGQVAAGAGGARQLVRRKSLRNAAINYRNGWFFVTIQAAHNKSTTSSGARLKRIGAG